MSSCSPSFESTFPLCKILAAEAYRKYPSMAFEELHHGAMLGLWKATKSFNPALGPWIPYARMRIRKAILDEIRRILGRRRIRDLSQLRDDVPSPARTVEEVDSKDECQYLLDKIHSIEGRLGDILWRNAICGETQQDIADSLGVTESRICQLVRDARGKLRKLVAS